MQPMLRTLLAVEERPKLTLQIPASPDPQARTLRLRHQLEEVAARIESASETPVTSNEIVERARAAAADPALVPARSGTGAVYVAGDFSLSVQWPAPLVERTVVDDEFFLVDVLELASEAHCYLLEVSRGGARLFQADPLTVTQVPLEDVPATLAEATAHLDPERQLQFHQSQPVGRGGTAATYHGHGIGEGRDVEELRSYLRAIDRGVRAAMAGAVGPVALIGADQLPALFTEVSQLGDLIAEVDHKHPDAVTPDELRNIADGVLAQGRAAEAATARERFYAGKGSTSLQAIVGAALHGRIETLLVGPDLGGSDLAVNRAAVATMRTRGRVLRDPDKPGQGALAAVFRY